MRGNIQRVKTVHWQFIDSFKLSCRELRIHDYNSTSLFATKKSLSLGIDQFFHSDASYYYTYVPIQNRV